MFGIAYRIICVLVNITALILLFGLANFNLYIYESHGYGSGYSQGYGYGNRYSFGCSYWFRSWLQYFLQDQVSVQSEKFDKRRTRTPRK